MSDRAATLAKLSTQVFDALVIGGGITGAGIARDAAMRGLSVALIDKGDFASGTSSRSSRLIHGGVRYLEHGHFHLVFEASAERRRLLRLAPHLVRPLAFTWPVYTGQRLPLWKLAAGLTLYDMLSMFRNVERHCRLSDRGIAAIEPSARRDGLRGGVRYFDAGTDDARLTLANVLDATRHSAVTVNHVRFAGVAPDAGRLRVARVEDALTGNAFEVRARLFVNATGPWSDAVRQLEGGRGGARVQGSKGAHIAVERARVGNRDAVTMIHPRDGRVLFALPAGEQVIIGTTDTFTSASPDDVRANNADVEYLLEAANWHFPDSRLERGDVVAAWAGIRPLMPTSGSEGAASREHAIKLSVRGSVTITGGKLTTYRVMAGQAVDVVARSLGVRARRAPTGSTPIPDHPPPSDPSAMLRHAVEREMACTLGDLLIRRTKVAFETRDNGRAAARKAAEVVAPLLRWDAARRASELKRYDDEVARLFTVD